MFRNQELIEQKGVWLVQRCLVLYVSNRHRESISLIPTRIRGFLYLFSFLSFWYAVSMCVFSFQVRQTHTLTKHYYNQPQACHFSQDQFIKLKIRENILLGEELEYRGRFYEYISAPSPTICMYGGLGLLIINYRSFRFSCVQVAMTIELLRYTMYRW